MEIKLIVLQGKHKDREIPLPETIFLIGRDKQCHLRPHCLGVSKLHCAIAAWAGKVRVRDLNSCNGTLLNGHAIHGEVGAADGDQLQVGDIIFAFKIRNEDGTPRPAPIKDDQDLNWLLSSLADSGVLATEAPTCTIPKNLVDGAEAKQSRPDDPARGVAATTPGSKALSAGQRLRAYFEQRKHPPEPRPGLDLPENRP